MTGREASADDQVSEGSQFVRQTWPQSPRVAIVLGTGMGELAGQIETDITIPYEQIPHFPQSTALGHAGRLVCGRLHGVSVVALDGRFHFYEGYSAQEITLPIAVLKQLGVELLILSNASGGLNPRFRSGDVMAIADHINWMGARTSGLGCGPSAPSRSGAANPYDHKLIDAAQEIARRAGFSCQRGTYVAVLGPNYETRAEYRALRRIGGDAVGMSTVPEVLAAMRCGLRVFALSTITNVARPDAPTTTDPQEVIDIAAKAAPRLQQIICGLVQQQFVGVK